ncbi:hypothetical protein FM102_05430 [Corynebacterium glutamicum]|nr:hypothetical protein FM102_05430 [Corynebacterium glutamicum]
MGAASRCSLQCFTFVTTVLQNTRSEQASSLQLGFAGFLIFISIYMGFQNFPDLF